MTCKTSELTGHLLDYWVAKALGLRCALEVWPVTVPRPSACWLLPEGARLPNYSSGPYAPSTEWAQGGPIIERERIALHLGEDEGMPHWLGFCVNRQSKVEYIGAGVTPLEAAMRALVWARIGGDVGPPT